MAIVTCKYCGKKFDREKEPYIQIPWGQKAFRYGHPSCYLEAVNSGKEKNQYEIFDPKDFKNCFWCAQAIKPTDVDVIELPNMFGRYAHIKCAQEHPCDDREKFKVYIIKLYKLKDEKIWPGYLERADKIAKEYNFTYSGMTKALEYFHKVKQHAIDSTKEPTPGIIPYIYNQAYKYYYNLWLANEANKQKDLTKYIPKDKVVTIQSPQKQGYKRKLFTFLDKEDADAQ